MRLAQAQTIGAQLPAPLRTALLAYVPGVLFGAQTLIVASGLRGPPLVLSPQAQAYVQPSPVRRAAIVLMAFGRSWILVLLGSAGLALLVMTALVPDAPVVSLLAAAGVLALWVALSLSIALLGRWVVSCLRVRAPPHDRHDGPLASLRMAGLVLLVPSVVVAVVPNVSLLAWTTAWWVLLVLGAVVGGLVFVLIRVSDQLDVARVADAGAGQASLRGFGPWAAVINPEGMRTLTGRTRLSTHTPAGELRSRGDIGVLMERGLVAARRDPRELLVRCVALTAVAMTGSVLVASSVLTPTWLQWLALLAALRPLLTDPNLEVAVNEPFMRQFVAGHVVPLLLSGTLVPTVGATVIGFGYWTAVTSTVSALVTGVLLTGLGSLLVPLISGWCLVRASRSGWAHLLLSSGIFGGMALAYAVHPVASLVVGVVFAALLYRQIKAHDYLLLPAGPGSHT